MDRSARERLEPPGRTPEETECDDLVARMRQQAQTAAGEASVAQNRITRLVQTLESDIIPRLVRAHRADDGPAAAVPATVWPDLGDFARHCYAADEGTMHAAVHALRQAGCPVERLYLDLLAPAARELGRLWEEDLCDFTDVTVGVGRLQQLLRELSPSFGAEIDHPADGRRILLVPAPGEQHTLGVSKVSEFFWRAGWDVVGGVGGSGLDPVKAVQTEWFDILGLSAGHHARVDWLRDCIASARQLSRNRGLGVLVGGPLFIVQPEYISQVGCDAAVTEGQRGPECAEALLASRVQRL